MLQRAMSCMHPNAIHGNGKDKSEYSFAIFSLPLTVHVLLLGTRIRSEKAAVPQ